MIGTIISHYKILEKLGGGGMGVVYKAQDLKLDRLVALKFLPPDLTFDPDSKERFIHEAKAASALQHNNICVVHDIDETADGQMFICMELYEGETLKNLIDRGPLAIEEALEIAHQVAQGLQKAHDKGIVHRDVKPANIIITSDRVAKIVDFGLAKLTGQTRLTRTGSTAGTAAFMSPEQARGEKVDKRTDIWSFGVVLYQMITGDLPFKSDYDTALVYSILNEEPKPMSSLRNDVPPGLDRIVKKAMAKNVEDRYQSLEEISKDLVSIRQVLGSPPTTEIKDAEVSSARKRIARITGAVFSVLVIATIAIVLWQRSDTKRTESILAGLQTEINTRHFDKVHEVLRQAQVDLQDPGVQAVARPVLGVLAIETHPSRARVALACVHTVPDLSVDSSFEIGSTPIAKYALVAGEYLADLSFDGQSHLQFLLHLLPGDSLHIDRFLIADDGKSTLMARVEGAVSRDGVTLPPFLLDKFEVTNEQFFKFVVAGGYRNEQYWDVPIVIDGKAVLWISAVKKFVDKTGLPGPRFWSGGRYLEGTGNHPVVGVSWYEAMAYARWTGKTLPSYDQWWFSALGGSKSVFPWGDDVNNVQQRSNFQMKGTEPVGSYKLGVSPFGCYDMAGNVKEWLRGAAGQGNLRTVVGGSWRDASYMFEASHAESFEPQFASTDVGFRCARPLSDKP